MIHITSKLHGVEVAGMRHPATTVHYREDQIEPDQLAAFKESEYLTVEIDEPESQTIETGAGDDATDNQVEDADLVVEVSGETLPETDTTIERVSEGVAITEAESIAQAQPEPAAEAAATVEKKTAPASTRKPKK